MQRLCTGPGRSVPLRPAEGGPRTLQFLARGPEPEPGATSAVRGRAAAGPVRPDSKHQCTLWAGPERRYLELSPRLEASTKEAPGPFRGSQPPLGPQPRHDPGEEEEEQEQEEEEAAAGGNPSIHGCQHQGRLRSAAPGLPGRRLPGPGAAARSPGLYPGPPDPASPTCTAPAPLGPPTRRLRCPDSFRPGRAGSSVRIRAGGAGRRNRR
ncbi:MAPK-interacting and spindle-stabilizing protein-like [Lagopus leucura]|uniref:MAPK-interacting and spindle-stabilizing protein-like n=1 Tax=Lagopus leucura TaxID=30410 RepID=UPI001C67BB75|nr:MAPK-interacting and spindle-stabilizing protein-like [Lagopus leucura]